jgi:GAF domain-containing protein
MSDMSEGPQTRRLVDVARRLGGDLDPERVFERILRAARELTGARYAALGVLNEQRTELERFHAAGIDDDTHRAIGHPPRGRGVLGVLITDPRPLRLTDVDQHPLSYGFPDAHPAMNSFLGVPIDIRGEVWGNLYLAEKDTGHFTEDDQEIATALADWAAAATQIARMHQASKHRRLNDTPTKRSQQGVSGRSPSSCLSAKFDCKDPASGAGD